MTTPQASLLLLLRFQGFVLQPAHRSFRHRFSCQHALVVLEQRNAITGCQLLNPASACSLNQLHGVPGNVPWASAMTPQVVEIIGDPDVVAQVAGQIRALVEVAAAVQPSPAGSHQPQRGLAVQDAPLVAQLRVQSPGSPLPAHPARRRRVGREGHARVPEKDESQPLPVTTAPPAPRQLTVPAATLAMILPVAAPEKRIAISVKCFVVI